MKSIIINILFIGCSVLSMLAQDITINAIPLLDRLPVNAIHRVFQDSDGYMWYGTVDGLCRDDGYSVKVFRGDLENPDMMVSNHILAIVEDQNKKIWFGTQKGVYILDKRTYKIHPLNDDRILDKNIVSMSSTNDGSIWICIVGTLFRYNSEEKLQKIYPLTTGTVHHVFEDMNNHIVISIWRDAIYKLNEETDTLEPFATHNYPKKFESTYCLRDKNNPYYWIGSDGQGIIRFDPSAHPDSMYIPQPLPINSNKERDGFVFFMAQDDVYGYLWVTSFTDLFVYDITEDGMLKQLDTSPFFPQNTKMLNEIIKGKNGNLWVSAYDFDSFIINFMDNAVIEYPLLALKERVNGNPAIVSLSKDESGVFWLSHERMGLYLYFPEIEEIKHFTDFPVINNLPLNNISQIYKSNTPAKVWVAPYSNQVYGMSQKNKTVHLSETIDLLACTANSGVVEYLYEDMSNNLWIGTTTSLFMYNKNSRLKLISDSLGFVTGITGATDGAIWVCTYDKGIYRVDKEGNYVQYPIYRDFTTIDCTSNGKLWLGNEQGNVLFFDPHLGILEDYSRKSGMKGDRINKIIVDSYNHIWIYMNQKITEYNPANGAFRNYLASDEWLLLNRFLPRSAFKDRDGTLYFGGMPGFISMQPTHHLESIPKQVETHITDIEIMGHSLISNTDMIDIYASPLKIAPDDQNIVISFSTLDHYNAQKIRYAYRLVGVDNDWVYIGDGHNRALYNKLDKGEYTFQVKATDENGLWSDQITELSIIRLPAFSESWWAYCLYAIMAGALLWGILHLYLQRIKHANEKKLAEQMAQMKLHYFTNISHELLTPLTIISCVTDEMEMSNNHVSRTGLLKSNVERLKRLLQQVLDFRKVEYGNMALRLTYGNIVPYVRDICDSGFSLMAEKKNIQFSFSSLEEEIIGYFDTDKLDKVLFNLLSNAFKYTPEGKKVWLHMKTYDEDGHKKIYIEVGDEGIGIAPSEQNNIFTRFYNNKSSEVGKSNGIGLSLTKEFVTLHHGQITLISQQGQGSVFTVKIPIDRESYSTDELPDTFVPETGRLENLESLEKTDYTLLLVEDNEDLLVLMSDILAKEYNVITANNGKAALEIVRMHHIDCIVSDIVMSEINGLELCATIKNNIETSHIIVVLLTAKRQTEDRLDSYEAGADAYIPKPFDVKVLRARLKNLLKNRQQRQQEFRQEDQLQISTFAFSSMDEDLIKKAMKLVEANLGETDFDVESLASLLLLSRSTLTRKIKTICGITPLEFIRNIRMKHACQMLKNKNMTISEVAMSVGYVDRKYFAACFKDEFGITPSEYQKEHTSQV